MSLTDTSIRAAKPTDKTQRLFDGGGMYLEVSPAGGKWFRFKYRFDGKEKRLSLGTYPDTGLAEAREKRAAARKLLASGVDPSAARKAEREASRVAALNSVEAVVAAWLDHRRSEWTPGTMDAIKASLDNHVLPYIGTMPIKAVQPRHVRELVQAVEAAGARETAGRVFQRLRAVWRYAVSHDLADSDPTYSLKPSEILSKYQPRHRAALDERDLPAFLAKLDAYDGDIATKCALQLLLLTATRPGELRGARWAEVDEDAALWRIPGERTKMKTPHLVPLSKQSLQLLHSLKTLAGRGDLVFPSPFYPGKPLSDGTLNSAIARMGYKGSQTAHGFRSLFSTAANEAGWPPDVIEKQLAHEERDDVRGSYNRAQHLAERKKLMQWWADRLDHLRSKGA